MRRWTTQCGVRRVRKEKGKERGLGFLLVITRQRLPRSKAGMGCSGRRQDSARQGCRMPSLSSRGCFHRHDSLDCWQEGLVVKPIVVIAVALWLGVGVEWGTDLAAG